MFYSFLALISGANVAVSIMLNARLGAVKGIYRGAFINYLVGFVIALPLFFIFSGFGAWAVEMTPVGIFLLTGGSIGYFVVLINSRITPRIGIMYVTILLFIGQIFTGAMIDVIRATTVSAGKIIGASLILAGLVYLVRLEKD